MLLIPHTTYVQVDYTGFCTINAQRFGQKFVGRVANPHDLLLFSKAASRKANPETGARAAKHIIKL